MSVEKVPVNNKVETINLDELFTTGSISSSTSNTSSTRPRGLVSNFIDSFKRASGKLHQMVKFKVYQKQNYVLCHYLQD